MHQMFGTALVNLLVKAKVFDRSVLQYKVAL